MSNLILYIFLFFSFFLVICSCALIYREVLDIKSALATFYREQAKKDEELGFVVKGMSHDISKLCTAFNGCMNDLSAQVSELKPKPATKKKKKEVTSREDLEKL